MKNLSHLTSKLQIENIHFVFLRQIQNFISCLICLKEAENTLTQTCLLCKAPCSLCSGESTNCTSCTINTYLSQFKCLNTCPDGDWADSSLMTCRPCSPPCSKCLQSPTKCTACTVETFLTIENKCVSDCPTGFWNDKNDNTCKNCSSFCLTCSGKNPSFSC